MKRLTFSIEIDAPVGKTWDTMLQPETYNQWTEAFMEGSHYEGSWEEGSKILFLAPGEDGAMSGMVSRIRENREHEFISIEHLGMVENGVEDTESESVQSWAGALENYTFRDLDGRTEVRVEMDINDDYKEMFEEIWPKALNKLKQLAEA